MVRSKTDPEKREAAVERILGGLSTIGREALRLRVSKQAVAGWVTAARKKKADPLDAGMPDQVPAGPFPSDDVTGKNEERLRRARKSAGIGGVLAGAPSVGESTDEEETSSIPAPSPDELVALCETIRALGLRTYAGILGVDVSDKRVEAVFAMSEAEKTALRMAAPYAAKYVPALVGHSDASGAVVFVAIFALSIVSSSAVIREVAREAKAVEEARPAEGSPVGSSRIHGLRLG
jgi:hypothetical protein